ncbi:deoxyribonuclease HsdR [Flavobacterium akiainvivens]|uniref:Deoxyribonuclease HsdR n=1 Tax=Flavobacterium akiainvivens TaxID=1202724 RepID=A0A0M8MFZ0_9FLAO|nr:HTTM domain-containing protein [Flavobacterium akiainvivens]KOS08084.1 deoxyribonuclease HsdR [Flavobacterium akiainvivens]SFQ71670.1 Vitamin K-dependent gamma-carboxylase [Flavobacterium akiainvivens]
MLTFRSYLNLKTDAASLAFFRVAFGLMMFFSIIRFAGNGWIDKFYIAPAFHFTYFGFGWVKPLGIYTYGIFIICALSALMVALGYRYRLGSILFFLSFTYIELMDKTTYLNHYYFISLVSFVMIFLPANAFFSLDAKRNHLIASAIVPRYTVDVLKVLLAIVYFYAGLAKLNTDWLINAMPLKIWLTGNTHLPLIGPWLGKQWVAYAFSYIGAVYDLFIVFLLLNRRTRLFGFVLVVVFHSLTRILFPIGVFPLVMIVSSLIFFSPQFHRRALGVVYSIITFGKKKALPASIVTVNKYFASEGIGYFLAIFIAIQLILPFRYLLYPGELFWTEEGFRFSWRVMLMEKVGYVQFRIVDSKTGATAYINNRDYLTAFQEKQMSFQPDFILEYAHYLHDTFKAKGMADPQVYAESYVALNGRLNAPYINPNVNLAKEHESFAHKTWILPFKDTIGGL